MTDRDLIALARRTLTDPEFRVWHAKHYEGLGRRAGSVDLGISEEAWRYRLASAKRKLNAVLQTHNPAA